MANYLYIIVKKNSYNLENFFEKYVKSEDVLHTEFGVYDIYFVSKIQNFLDKNFDGNIFYGYAIDYNKKHVHYGPDSPDIVSKFDIESLSGGYFSAKFKNGKILISSDYFSQIPVFNFGDRNIFAASDSLFLLYKIRKFFNLSSCLNFEEIRSRLWVNSITNQILNPDTPVSSIKFLPPRNSIEINLDQDEIEFKYSLRLKDFHKIDYLTYTDIVRRSAINILSLTKSLSKKYKLWLSLSGGLDSRVILACLLKNLEKSSFLIGSNEGMVNDISVVRNLSTKFNFQFNTKENFDLIKTKQVNPLVLYTLFSSGVYYSIYAPSKVPIHNTPLPISGHGTELYRGGYGFRSIFDISNDFDGSNRYFFESALLKGISQIGVDPKTKFNSEYHFFGYRNPLHGGRSVMFNIYALRPFLQKELHEYFYNDESSRKFTQVKTLVSDILIIISPELAVEVFDNPSKNMSKNYVMERLKILGGPLSESELSEFSIFGSPSLFSSENCIFSGIVEHSKDETLITNDVLRQIDSYNEFIPSEFFLDFEKIKKDIDKGSLRDESLRSALGRFLMFKIYN